MTTALCDEVLAAVAAVGLPGSLRELPRAPLSEHEAHALVAAAGRHGIAGMALAATRTGELLLPADAGDALAIAHESERATSRRLEQELVSVTTVLDGAGVASRALGDVAVAHLDHRDPALRAIATLDLLLRPVDVGRAIAALRREGWQVWPGRSGPDLRSGTTLTGSSGSRVHVRTTVHPGLPRPGGDDRVLWTDGRPFRIGEREVTALGDELRLLHSCCQAVAGGPGLPPLVRQRDVAEAVLFGTWNRARLMRLAVEWHAEEFFAEAIRAAWQRLAIADVTGLSVWAGVDRPDRGRRARGDRPPARVRPRPPLEGTWRSRFSARLT